MAAGHSGQQSSAAKNEGGETKRRREKRFDLQPGISCGAKEAPAFKDKSNAPARG